MIWPFKRKPKPACFRRYYYAPVASRDKRGCETCPHFSKCLRGSPWGVSVEEDI